jgi:hypothetical protein
MAEYYPLLAKAVAGLPTSTVETRRAIYERARKALIGQLRNLQPPVPEEDIERESQALDSAVARLESELSAQKAAAPEEREMTTPVPPAANTSSAGAKPLVSGAGPQNSGATRPPAPRPSLSPQAARATQPIPSPVNNLRKTRPATTAEPEKAADDAQMQVVDLSAVPNSSAEMGTGAAAGGFGGTKARRETQRPYALQPAAPDHSHKHIWIVGGVVALVVVLVAVAAWKLRDRPEDLARLKAPPAGQTEPANGKIADRIGGPKTSSPARQSASTPSGPAASGTTTGTATQNAAPGNQDMAARVVPVAHRAALLVEAPTEQNKVKTYLGTVVWRLDNVSNGPGQPLGTAVRADIDIPEDKFQATMTFQRNDDATLPASHTMKLLFMLQSDSPTGGIKDLSVPQLRREEAQNGEALSGIAVPIMENSFLIGLSRGNAEGQNLDLVRAREWFDVPLRFANGRIAKLTFEKSTSGQRAIDEAIGFWQGQ